MGSSGVRDVEGWTDVLGAWKVVEMMRRKEGRKEEEQGSLFK